MDDMSEDFDKIYNDFFPKIVGYLKRLVGERDAEDITQEVFIKVNTALIHFRGESSLPTWIYRIATNAAMDHLRKPSSVMIENIENGPSDDEPLSCEMYTADDENSPLLDSQLIRNEMNKCIRGIVDGLPENYRTVLVLSDLEGLTNNEIVEVLDISLETVKIRLHRARTRLRKELGTNCNFYRDERNELACDRKFPLFKVVRK